MKQKVLHSAVLFLFLLVPASITWAQNVSVQNGLTTVVFNLPQGLIKVYLPDDIRPGDIISGQLLPEPAGKNIKEKTKNRTALSAYSVSMYNEKLPVPFSGRPFQISIPAGNPVRCGLILLNAAGQQSARTTVRSIPETDQQAAGSEYMMVSHVLTGSSLRITGPFDGNSSNTFCSINNKAPVILAESPRQCILSYPADAAGPHTLIAGDSGKPNSTKMVTGVDMKIVAGKLNLLKGQTSQIEVRIGPLNYLPDTAYLIITNTSADVITMTGGNTITIPVPPPADTANGVFTRSFEVQSIRTGAFTVHATLSLPEPAPLLPPVVSASKAGSEKNAKLRLAVNGRDISINYDDRQVETKENDTEHVHVIGNTIRIFLNGVFENEFELINPGTASVQEILTEYSDADYAPPAIDCDSLSLICNKNAAFNVFWGNVYSTTEGKAGIKLINGESRETGSQHSLLITRGWEIDCCTGEFALRIFFQSMKGGGGPGSHAIIFSKLLKTGKPCPLNCPECKKKCADMQKLMEEARKKMGN